MKKRVEIPGGISIPAEYSRYGKGEPVNRFLPAGRYFEEWSARNGVTLLAIGDWDEEGNTTMHSGKHIYRVSSEFLANYTV